MEFPILKAQWEEEKQDESKEKLTQKIFHYSSIYFPIHQKLYKILWKSVSKVCNCSSFLKILAMKYDLPFNL